MNKVAQHHEVENQLRVTGRPVTSRSLGTGPDDEEVRTFYICGFCRIIVGYTPLMSLGPGDVVRCPNCGTHNEL